MYMDDYKRWLEADLEDPALKEELESIQGKDDEIKDRFAVALKFGTAGLRGVLGAGTNRMNIYVVRQATQGLANWVKTQGGNQLVAISFDSRINSDVFAKTAACVLATNGIRVRIYDALMPVPALSFATRYYKANAGIMVTASHNPDIVLLDLGLPDLDGIEVIRRIRSWSNVPIIVISARSEDTDKIDALDAGADDYLTKPFSVEELLARLRVTQRRLALMQGAGAQESVYQNGELKIDYASGCAYFGGEELHLTPIEYKLLCLLAKNTGKVLTHKYITQSVWGSNWENDVASLRVFMATLRKKLEKGSGSTRYIQTHIGVGYRMLRVE